MCKENNAQCEYTFDELSQVSLVLYRQAEIVKENLNVIQSMIDNLRIYRREMEYSGAFYNICYDSLMYATTMQLSRIFDRQSKSIGLCIIVKEILKQLNSGMIDNQEMIEEAQEIAQTSSSKEINKYIVALKAQRDMVYAHTDRKVLYGPQEVIERYPLSMKEISRLADFALKTSRFAVLLLNKIKKEWIENEKTSLENTLRLLQVLVKTV